MTVRTTASRAPGAWSPGQEAALADVSRWMRGGSSTSQVYCLFGAAGTGKSTLVRELVAESARPWLFAAFTGKAALVMRQKGCVGATTIHSLIYRPSGETRTKDGRPQPTFRLHEESPLLWAPGVVIDECSMVDEQMGRDLLSFGKKVLVCGDPWQLPPIGGGGFFTGRTPDCLLTEIHRQARESSILDLATFLREGGDPWKRLDWSTEDCAVVHRGGNQRELWGRMTVADQVIVGLNRTRHKFNVQHRRLLGARSHWPAPGDKLVCLRNDRELGLFNGSMWCVQAAELAGDERTIGLELSSVEHDSQTLAVRSWAHHFDGREHVLDDMAGARMEHGEFGYGYNITCHKAQGSQYGDVVLYDESRSFDGETARRWLYTGVTRAADRLLLVV